MAGIVFIIGVIIIFFCLTGCATTTPAVAPDPAPTPIIFTLDEVGLILATSITDIRTQGCEPLFLGTEDGLIWCECTDAEGVTSVKLYQLQKVIQAYREAKASNEAARPRPLEGEFDSDKRTKLEQVGGGIETNN